MLRRNRISSDSPDTRAPRRGGRLRNAFVDAGWAIREHVFWRLGDGLRNAGDAAKWPFERLAWAVRHGLVWRVEDRAAALGPVARGATYGLAIVLAAGAGVAGLLLASPDRAKEDGAPVALATPVAAPTALPDPQPQPKPKPKPTLQGATPVFKPESEGGKGKAEKKGGTDSSSDSPSDSTDSGEAKPLAPILTSSGAKPAAAATSSSARKKGAKVAGPEAIDVARRFAAAFTKYETGEDDKKVRKAFAETAAPELRKALLRRPPRLPANVEVPKAKVLNVVPGPAQGGIYSVSVSLLRVGLTSELRLDMEPSRGKQWRVTDILG
jgi:hypothetical protein